MSNYKIIFTGPVGAGKSTAIASISDIEPFTTEEVATDETMERKEKTTVAMDYGLIKLDNNERIHLYGTPGQERFNFMWEVLSMGGLGLIILIDNQRPDPFMDLQFYINAFKKFIKDTAMAIGVTRCDTGNGPNINDYNRVVKDMNLKAPVFEIDARERKDVNYLMQALLFSLDPTLN